MSTATMVAPFAASARAMLRPMPREAPVTTAILSLGITNSFMFYCPTCCLSGFIGKSRFQFCLGYQLVIDKRPTLEIPDATLAIYRFHLEAELVAREHRSAEFCAVNASKIGDFRADTLVR